MNVMTENKTTTLTPSEALAKLDRWATSTALLGYDFDRAYSLAEIRDALSAVVAENERLTKFREYVVGYFTETDDEAVLCRLDSLWHEVGPEGRQAINVMNERHAGLLSENESLRAERAADALDRLLKCAANASPYLSSDSQAAIKFALATLRAPAGEPVDRERVAQLIAHRACCGTEHDPLNGKLHGYCVVCGVDWPCEYAGKPPTTPPVVSSPPSEAAVLERPSDEWYRARILANLDTDEAMAGPNASPSPAEQGARDIDPLLFAWMNDRGLMPDADADGTVDMNDVIDALTEHETIILAAANAAPLAAGRVGVAEADIERAAEALFRHDFNDSDQWHNLKGATRDGYIESARICAKALAGPLVAGEVAELPALIDRYWELAYAEGKEGRDHDTEAGDAQKVRSRIDAILRPLVYADTAKGSP
jgi:hypothetical protein